MKEIKTQQNILFTIQLLADLRLKEIQKEDTLEPNTTTIPFTSVPLVTEFGNIVKSRVPVSSEKYAAFFTTAPTVPTKGE